jgi:3D (Asp-Asp-Asp) domain-containing protein
MAQKYTAGRIPGAQMQRKLMLSDLLPISLTKAWIAVRRAFMFSIAITFLGLIGFGATRTLAHTAPQTSELMHDLIQAPDLTTMSHQRIVWMQVTAYCPCPKCCGPHAAGITASGKLIDYNAGRFIAADTTLLPFGSKVIIPGYGSDPVEVIDRGSAIKGNHIDVFFATHDQAMHWGRQWLPITIVD